MRIENCTSCKKDHADIDVSQKTSSNGRPYIRYTCPETSKTVTRFVSGPTKPHASGGKPAKKAGDSASGHATASGPGNDVNVHVDVNNGGEARARGKAPSNRGGGGSRATPPGGSMQRTVTLDAEALIRVIPASGWDVCAGMVERLQELGVGSPSLPAILAHADQAAAQATGTTTTQARKDAKERQVGRDLADILVLFMASERIGPQDFGGMYPRTLANAWGQAPDAFQRAPAGGAGGGYAAGGNGGGGAPPDLAAILRGPGGGPGAPGGGGTVVQNLDPRDTDGNGSVSFSERFSDNKPFFSLNRLGKAGLGVLAGSELGPVGMVAGGVGGFLSEELGDVADGTLGDGAGGVVTQVAAGAAGAGTFAKGTRTIGKAASAGNQLEMLNDAPRISGPTSP